MKSHLSHILPVAEACSILEEPTVRRIVRSFLSCRSPKVDPQEEILLMRALAFTADEEVPSDIQSTWNRYTKRTMGLDKMALLKWLVPAHAGPHSGPGGHLGLFDCLVHGMSASANHHSSLSSTTTNIMLTPVVLLPDLLIVLAICKEYAHAASDTSLQVLTDPDNDDNEFAIMMLSVLAFRVYDSYQKKGMVARDTIHRFLTDVYGEDSYKRSDVRGILDKMFTSPDDEMLTLLSGTQFCHGIAATVVDGQVSHVLLDWLAKLIIRLIPPGELPLSTQAYLETIGSSHRSVERLCQEYGLAGESSRLYEIKRRFHSMVESSNVIHGDPMNADATSVQDHPVRPKHVISETAFCKAVSQPSSDMGHGGYLPESLAKLTFRAASCDVPVKEQEQDTTIDTKNAADDDDDSCNVDTLSSAEGFWALFDVLQFGCYAVRRPATTGRNSSNNKTTAENTDLVKFAFRVFGLLPGAQVGHKVLTRTQVGHMLLLLLEHSTFRLEADSPPNLADERDESESIVVVNEDDLEATMIEATQASLLSLLPPDVTANKVPLKDLIDHILGDRESLTFDTFCSWNSEATGRLSSQQRLGPYLLDLRMIAAILFGVPPSYASLEKKLVEESSQRHKYRYPQTDASRRGPRGTIWYILDDRWYRNWMAHVQRVSGTDQDAVDNRDVLNASPRGLPKINNTGLLADNGSLALRADIKWRQDYEIVAPMAWSALQAWYDGGPPIHRTVVPYIPTTGAPSPHSRVPRVRTAHEIELYPYFVTLFLCDTLSRGEARPFQQYVPVSRVCPVRMLLVQLCRGLDVDPKYGRLWMMGTDPTRIDAAETGSSDWLLNLDDNIVEQLNRRGSSAILENGNSIVLLLELKDPETQKWPRGVDGKTWTFEREGGNEGGVRQQPGFGDGIMGLYNMGNTCYLNSSIQCLSHTPIFRDYFNSKVYLNDINTTNPLGHEGRLAQVSAVLINTLWKYNQSSALRQPRRITSPGQYVLVNAPAVTPKTFKDSLGKFNDHFSGNEQHDAQELLAFILDGLSEDLNRIVDKPYIEAPDSDGRPDSELADIWWENHLKRELSIIVALFTGQYKSLLTCRSCKYESARFEPFLFLQLPLPEDDKISVSLVLYPLQEWDEPMKYSVRVKHDGNLSDVLLELAKVLYADRIDEEKVEEVSSDENSANDDDTDEGTDPELEAKYKEISSNLAVVDMRDGYIFKIAPNSWSLPELQNKDSGEVPLLQVYQLEPIPNGNNAVVTPERFDRVEATEETPSEQLHERRQGTSVSKATVNEDEGETVAEQDEESIGEDANGSPSNNPEEHRDDRDDVANGDKKPGNEFAHAKRVELRNEPISNAESKGASVAPNVKFSFLALAQRRTELANGDMLHPFTHHVFGTPLLLRVVDLEGYSGRDLYDLVAKRMRNFVPKPALRFLDSDHKDDPREEEDEYEKKVEDSMLMPRAGSRKRRHRTTTDMEEVAAGPVPRYGFRLRLTSRDGKRCALCPWYECCIGCLVPDDDYPTIVTCGDSIVMDWHFAVDIATSGFAFRPKNQLESQPGQLPARGKQYLVPIKNHSSYGNGSKKKGASKTVTLEQCLDAFAQEERIPEAYCSRCQEFRVQTKRMSLWRLPPVIIIHLKRFQFTQHARRKLRDLVTFPIEGLDLSRIMATDSSSLSSNTPPTNGIMDGKKQHDEKEADDTEEETEHDDDDDDDDSADDGDNNNNNNREQQQHHSRPPPPPTASSSSSNNIAAAGCSREDMLYDLYGVVHHQGALSGGHYVASLKSELDGQWRLFNDAQIYDIHSRDIVDASAYMLFYIRRNARGAKLEDFWDTTVRDGEGCTEEEMNKLMKGRSDRCVIS